jgi:ribonuclease HI
LQRYSYHTVGHTGLKIEKQNIGSTDKNYMGKDKNKYFVVWKGFSPGIYETWQECQKQIQGYPNAKFKGFKTYEVAKQAYEEGYENYWGNKNFFESTLSKDELKRIGQPIVNSISVDAGFSSSSIEMEYQGVKTDTKELLFRKGPYRDATNNIGEFLAIVHALAYLKEKKSAIPIYSDSAYAIKWVKNKKHQSNLARTPSTEKIYSLLERAELWLHKNTYPNKILKWETRAWGENPADFGRK